MSSSARELIRQELMAALEEQQDYVDELIRDEQDARWALQERAYLGKEQSQKDWVDGLIRWRELYTERARFGKEWVKEWEAGENPGPAPDALVGVVDSLCWSQLSHLKALSDQFYGLRHQLWPPSQEDHAAAETALFEKREVFLEIVAWLDQWGDGCPEQKRLSTGY